MEDNWENLAGALPGLSLSERSPAAASQATASADNAVHASEATKPPAESSSAQPQNHVQSAPAPAAEYEAVDAAIKQALSDPTQRLTVLKCEDLVEKFLADPCQEALQFPASFTSYQRMLAHRVGQYYGLQTSTVDYEDSQGRVVAIRLKNCYDPKPRLRELDVPISSRSGNSNGVGGPVADKPRLLRRGPEDDRSQQTSSEHSLNQSPARSMNIKERQESYMKAREELGLGSVPHDGMAGPGRGGRGGPGGRFGNGGRMDGGRGRKAMFRDKDKDLSDPDYRRGMNRFNGTARFDPAYPAIPAGGMYQVPTYSSEFPALNRMPSGASNPAGRPHMQQHPQALHQMPPGPHPHPMSGHQPHPGPGPWGQPQQQVPGVVRPPPPPPPPHHHASGPGSATGGGGGGGGGPGGKGNHQGNGGGVPGRAQNQHAQQQQQQPAAAYGPTMAAAPYPGVGPQYPVPVAMGATGFMPGGQPMFGMAAAGGAIPGAMYAAPAPGVSGAFYPTSMGVGMGMGAVGMAVPATGAYGYVAAPAPGVVASGGEAIALPQGAYPMYAGYPAGAAMYPAAAAAQMPQPAAMHPAGGAAIPIRPMYGVPAFYPQYDPSQYPGGSGMQGHGQGQGEGGRMYGGGYGGYHGHHQQQHHHGGPQHAQPHHGGGGMASQGHGGHGGGRGRDSDSGGARVEQQSAPSPAATNATSGGSGTAADGK